MGVDMNWRLGFHWHDWSLLYMVSIVWQLAGYQCILLTLNYDKVIMLSYTCIQFASSHEWTKCFWYYQEVILSQLTSSGGLGPWYLWLPKSNTTSTTWKIVQSTMIMCEHNTLLGRDRNIDLYNYVYIFSKVCSDI